LRIIDLIGKEGAHFKILGEPWADTTSPHGRLTLTILVGVAEFQRELILDRTNEGRARAMAEGKRFGRKPKLTSTKPAKPSSVWLKASRCARSRYAVDHSTISRLKARHAAEV
jgi:DNA invertase Pin-like site-specific DNA recombinase